MNRIFGTSGGGGKKAPPPDLDASVSKLNDRNTTVDKKIAALDAELLKYRNQMAKMSEGGAKNAVKQKALRVLKQKKVYEKQREATGNQAFNMEQANFAIQTVKDTKTTVDAMKVGVKQFKKEYKHIDIGKIEDLQDEMADMMEQSNDIQDILAQDFTGADQIDEADLDAELEALGDDMALGEDTGYLDDALNAPTVPSAAPGSTVPAGGTSINGVAVDEFGLPQIPQTGN